MGGWMKCLSPQNRVNSVAAKSNTIKVTGNHVFRIFRQKTMCKQHLFESNLNVGVLRTLGWHLKECGIWRNSICTGFQLFIYTRNITCKLSWHRGNMSSSKCFLPSYWDCTGNPVYKSPACVSCNYLSLLFFWFSVETLIMFWVINLFTEVMKCQQSYDCSDQLLRTQGQ